MKQTLNTIFLLAALYDSLLIYKADGMVRNLYSKRRDSVHANRFVRKIFVLRKYLDKHNFAPSNGGAGAFFPTEEQCVPLRLFNGENGVAEGVTDINHRDLHERGFRGGACAFAFVLPEVKLEGDEHVVNVVNVRMGDRLLAHIQIYRLECSL